MWLTNALKGIGLALSDVIFPLRNTASLVRDVTLETFRKLLTPHLLPSGHTGLLPYRYAIVRAVILEAKFHRNPKAFSLLGSILTEYIDSLQEEMHILNPGEYTVVPIPLSTHRYRERGYNQIEEVLKSASISYDNRAIIRIQDTKPQTSLSKKARTTNVKDAFVTRGTFQRGATYIVVDDVTTTGATLNEIGTILRNQNLSVVTLALAY